MPDTLFFRSPGPQTRPVSLPSCRCESCQADTARTLPCYLIRWTQRGPKMSLPTQAGGKQAPILPRWGSSLLGRHDLHLVAVRRTEPSPLGADWPGQPPGRGSPCLGLSLLVTLKSLHWKSSFSGRSTEQTLLSPLPTADGTPGKRARHPPPPQGQREEPDYGSWPKNGQTPLLPERLLPYSSGLRGAICSCLLINHSSGWALAGLVPRSGQPSPASGLGPSMMDCSCHGLQSG